MTLTPLDVFLFILAGCGGMVVVFLLLIFGLAVFVFLIDYYVGKATEGLVND